MKAAKIAPHHLLDYWKILRKRVWFVLSAVLLTVGIGAIATAMVEPVFTATARLQIERVSPQILPFREVVGTGIDTFDFYATQETLIRSRTIAREVIRSLKLLQRPEYAAFAAEGTDEETQTALEAAAVNAFLKRVEVEQVEGALFDVSYSSTDPKLAARVANRIAEEFIVFNSQSKYNTTERATESLALQIADLRDELESRETELNDYARKNGILLFQEGQDAALRKLKELRAAHVRAQTDRIEKEARYAALKDSDAGSLPEMLKHEVISDLTSKLAQLEARHAQLEAKVKPEWPEMVRLENEIREMQARLTGEKEALFHLILGAAQADYQAARNEEQALSDAIAEEEQLSSELGARQIRYDSLNAEIREKKETLAAMVRRKSETTSSAGVENNLAGNVRVVDPAEVPGHARSPHVVLSLLVSLLLGTVLGVGAAFFLEYLDLSVRTAEEAQQATGFAVLGQIPRYTASRRRPQLVRGGNDRAASAEDRTRDDEFSPTAEAFRDLRTALLVSQAGGPPRTILVTGSQPGDGKTYVAFNLALSLAQLGRRTVLIDSDLRKPRLHVVLEQFQSPGLSTWLSAKDLEEIEPVATTQEKLDFIASGPPPPNPADLLDSARFGQILQMLADRGYDHVILDSPPVLPVADPAIVAKRVEGVVLIARAGVTGKADLAHAAEKLRQVRARTLGVVVNGIEEGKHGYSRYRPYETAPATPADDRVTPLDVSRGNRASGA